MCSVYRERHGLGIAYFGDRSCGRVRCTGTREGKFRVLLVGFRRGGGFTGDAFSRYATCGDVFSTQCTIYLARAVAKYKYWDAESRYT